MNTKELLKDLVKVSTYARNIGKSNELVRSWIRSGKLNEDNGLVVIDGVMFINKKEVKNGSI